MNAKLIAPRGMPFMTVSELDKEEMLDFLFCFLISFSCMYGENDDVYVVGTYEVCVSFEPENMITSAGAVRVASVFCRAESLTVTFLKRPIAVVATERMSPFP